MERVKLDFNFSLSGSVSTGLTADEFEKGKNKAADGYVKLKGMVDSGEIGFMKLPELDLTEIIATAKELKGKYSDIIVAGIGGSALGLEALVNALLPYGYNILPEDIRGGFPRIWIADNVDPYKISWILKQCNAEKTLLLVISKSGTTVETASNFLIIFNWLKENCKDPFNNIIAVTDPQKGLLRELSKEKNLRSFSVLENVGGRFSVLSAVGLLPAALLGINIEKLMEGAAEAVKNEKQFLMLSSIYSAFIDKGVGINVVMPYTSRLKSFADWFAQLWGESLGKRYNVKGEEVFFGATPVSTVGSIDQHSQLQLYKEGPFDKFISFFEIKNHHLELEIPDFAQKGYEYLKGNMLGQLLNIELYATEAALKRADRPSLKIIVDSLDEFTLGYILMLYQIATAITGLANEINPFDQPGVEEGKDYAYGILHRNGYDKKREEFERYYLKEDRFIV